MSVNLPFILVAAAEMNSAEALAVGFISTFVKCLQRQETKSGAMAFNCGAITLAVAAARFIFASPAVAS